ncbi:type II toxin-antitoxin system death-on-curing family toxin [Roseibium suaedae]|uniref:Prophage maintenance system killer protein n=1 Tax=Roseibium suaedae TaxID=735517 RepID=A0A1M7H1P8_9HYPH|nr:Fic family protein [Roseibium suaedae]SHM22348.1 Prophage maintenance system killer protein [Roseibium suaedae]
MPGKSSKKLIFAPKPNQQRINTILLARNTLSAFPTITAAIGQGNAVPAERFNWLEAKDLVLINRVHVEAVNGTFGIPNRSRLEAAVLRPQECHYEDGENDILTLAVHMMVGICELRPFSTANKVTAFSAGRTLLVANGYDFSTKLDSAKTPCGKIAMIDFLERAGTKPAVAGQFATWLRDFVRERPSVPGSKPNFKAEMVFPPETPKVSTREVLATL